MRRSYLLYFVAGLIVTLVSLPAVAQKSGTGSSGGATGTTGPAPPSRPVGPAPGSGQQPGYSQPQYQAPLMVNGRVLMDSGQPVLEPVTVGLECGTKSVQVIHTDLKGYFQFTLGTGSQSNMDFSASNDSPGGMSSFGGRVPIGGSQNQLTGCEVRVNVAGYMPLTKAITDRAEVTGVEIGTLHLTRIAGVTGSSISVTSMLVPNNARKEFEKGDKDVHNNHLNTAAEHLEKAVAAYDKYAAAWFELGNVYAADKEIEKSREAFGKSIAADPHYVPPYLSLANMELQNHEFEAAVETAGKALDLDPSIGSANFMQALGNYKLNRLEAADKSAQQAEKGPHQDMSDLHALHADIYLQEKNYLAAAAQMRAYLKEFPKGRYADELRGKLQKIEASEANLDHTSASDREQIAP